MLLLHLPRDKPSVILTGANEDGAMGLACVKDAGGVIHG